MGLKRHTLERVADNLAAVVDSGSVAEDATGESAEIDHRPVFEQESVCHPARVVCFADHLAAIVDAGSAAEAATGESAEIGDDSVFEQKRVRIPARGGRCADHLAEVVDAGSLVVVVSPTGESGERNH